MPKEAIVRFGLGTDVVDFAGSVASVGAEARAEWVRASRSPGLFLLLTGDRDYLVSLPPEDADRRAFLKAKKGRSVRVVFPGATPVRRRLADIGGVASAGAEGALDLTAGLSGAPPLWLHQDGRVSSDAAGPAPEGMAAEAALVNAARWISSRRTSTFERLFPPSAFRPDEPVRTEALSAAQARGLLAQVKGALAAAAVGGDAAKADADAAAQVRSAAITVLSHVVATSLKDAAFRDAAADASRAIFEVVAAERGDATARPALRAHATLLLQMRAPALSGADRDRVRALLGELARAAPPYERLTGTWSFAMCSAHEFHEGECDILVEKLRFREIEAPKDAPAAPGRWGGGYRVFEAPFKTPHGQPIRIFARSASPTNENHEMGLAYFTGVLINRHAQLGSFDMRAATVDVRQDGYKVMMNSQCAGLTTRFAISRMFPDADIYSSWDSTYFRKGKEDKVVASEGLDCFFELLEGMSRSEGFAAIDERLRRAQWHHDQAKIPGFVQFVGPAHPLVVARYSDVNQDGRADYYDGFLDFRLRAIAEDLEASATPRDPGVSSTQVSGEAAAGLNWAAGSMNRVTQYSDIWAGLAGDAELLYAFQPGGFYSQTEPPTDVPASPFPQALGRLPAVTRFQKTDDDAGLRVDVMFHSHLAHAAKELKRLLVAGDAMRRALDLGHLDGDATLESLVGQRAAVLLTLAGLLEFPADQNFIDGLWSMALRMLNLPEISRSLVRMCITEADHDLSNYYGSRRGLRQLLGELEKREPLAWQKLKADDPAIGRALALALE
jgi:hypothetical protein